MACSSCGGVTTVRAQTNPMPSKGAIPYGYEKTSGGFTAVRAQSGMSTATTNPLTNGTQGFTAVRAQSGVSTATTSPFGGSVNTKMTPQYGTSSMSGQRLTTTGGNSSSALNMSKYIGRGS
jgi:hypothetical protein